MKNCSPYCSKKPLSKTINLHYKANINRANNNVKDSANNKRAFSKIESPCYLFITLVKALNDSLVAPLFFGIDLVLKITLYSLNLKPLS